MTNPSMFSTADTLSRQTDAVLLRGAADVLERRAKKRSIVVSAMATFLRDTARSIERGRS